MRRIAALLAVFVTCFIVTPQVRAATTTPQPSWDKTGNWSEVWSDGFGGTALKTDHWTPGWFGTGNTGPVDSSEDAGYSSKNVTVSGGDLHLALTHQAVTTPNGTYPYTGALVSANTHFSYAYGAIEFDAYLPPGNGGIANWPALWTDGQSWPQDGEMDVMEGLDGPACYHFHSPAGGPGNCASGNFSGWHRFGADWEPGKVTYYYDGAKVGSISTGITSAPMYPIIDYTTDGTNPAPATMLVNWARVWQGGTKTTSGAPCGTTTTAPTYKHVIWLWMENRGYSQVIGSNSAPYTNSLAKQCGLATNYHNITHYSLPNYIGATTGFDYTKLHPFLGDCDPGGSCSTTDPSIFSQVDGAGLTWKAYEESMPSNCDKSDSGAYAVRHDPAPYLSLSDCSKNDVPYTQLSADLANGTLPSFSFITPNVDHDAGAEPGTLSAGDKWLSTAIPAILSSPEYQSGNTAIFLTWDEGWNGAEGEHCATNTSDPQNCQVVTVVISPSTPAGLKVGTLFNHWGLLATTEQMLGLPALREAATATSLLGPFNL